MSKPNNVRKMRKEITKSKRFVNDSERKLQCVCTHSQNGIPTVENMHNGSYRCTQCDKLIDIKRVQSDRVADSLSTLDSVCDQIKMSSSNSEGSRKTIDTIVRFQYDIPKVQKSFEFLTTNNERRNENNNRRRERRVSFN